MRRAGAGYRGEMTTTMEVTPPVSPDQPIPGAPAGPEIPDPEPSPAPTPNGPRVP